MMIMRKLIPFVTALIVLGLCSCSNSKGPVALESISFPEPLVNMAIGEQTVLRVVFYPENADEKGLTWSSKSPEVASVDGNGLVTAVSVGSTVITAVSVEGGYHALCKVNVGERVVTGTVSNVSCRNAQVSGKGYLTELTSGLEFGVMYSVTSGLQEGSSVRGGARTMGEDGAFSVICGPLGPSTTYYYRSYASASGETVYGQEKMFTTLSPDTMIRTGEVSVTGVSSVSFSAALELKDCVFEEMSYGFELTGPDSEKTVITAGNLAGNAFSSEVDGLKEDTAYSFCAFVTLDGTTYRGEARQFRTQVAPIDLGLSVRWSPINLGAASAEESGIYVSWGEASAKGNYSLSYYRMFNFESSAYTKYNSDDRKKTLDPSDDAASVLLGGKWRIPTESEWSELLSDCTWTYTSLNGVKGYNVAGQNGNSIFIPLSGYYSGTALEKNNSRGYYWTSNLGSADSKAKYVYLLSSAPLAPADVDRFYGYPVRPVSE